MHIPKLVKSAILDTRAGRGIWGSFRRRQMERNYLTRRDLYHREAQRRGLAYRESETAALLAARLTDRGYHMQSRRLGEIHTFAFVPRISWHASLYPDLHLLGPVTEFDYAALGYSRDEFARADRDGLARRAEMNRMILPALKAAHAARPVDWIYIYASGLEISARTIREISEAVGIPTVAMCLDDKHSWTGKWMGDHRAGQIDIAATVDLSWTSSRIACNWYLAEGGRPLYLPEGFDALTYHPTASTRDIAVSFVGGAYGYRPPVVRFLRNAGVPVRTFGTGWAGSCWVRDVNEIFNRSQINLGMGGIGYSAAFTTVKGRDFEIPAAGGGVYLTSYNSDLARHYVIGQEILCYGTLEEMLELIRYYLVHPDEAEQIAAAGRERCLREHRWLHRYRTVLTTLGILAPEEDGEPAQAGGLASSPAVRPTLATGDSSSSFQKPAAVRRQP